MSAPWINWRPASSKSDLAVALSGFETVLDVELRSRYRQRVLEKGKKRSRSLATKLDNCDATNPCSSPACPRCMRLVRRWFAGTLLESLPADAELLFVTIVPADGRIPARELPKFDLKRLIARIRRRFLRDAVLRNGNFAFAVDVTYEEPAGAWQWHVHGVAIGLAKPELKKALRRLFKPSPHIRRPVAILPLKDHVQQISYLLKAIWFRRAHYLSKKGRRTSKQYPVKGKQLRQLLIHLDRYRPTELILLVGMRHFPKGDLRTTKLGVIGQNGKTGPPTAE
jgi:hypothetical protein